MANVKVVGDALVITSALTLEDYKMLERYRKSALVLMGGEDKKEQIYRASTGEEGSFDKYGVIFNGETRDDDKLATATVLIDKIDGDVKEYVVNEFGERIMKLNQLEKTLPEVIEEIKKERETVKGSISIA